MCVIAMFSDDPIPPQDLDNQRNLFLSRVIQKQLPCGKRPYEKLTKTFTRKFGYDCFREDEFHIQNHVKMYQPNEYDQILYTEEEFLENILPNLAQDMTDDSKPQWEIIIISRVKCSDRDAIQSVRCFRYHHGYMDGATANLMFAHCLYDEDQQNFPHVINPMSKLKGVSETKIFLVKGISILSAAFTMLKTIYKAGRLKGRFVTKKYSGQRHFGWSQKLDAEILRKVKSVTNVSAPTILCTATGAALRKMNEKFKDSSILLNEKQVILGMINALLPYKSIEPMNKFTLTHFNLNIGDISWVRRLHKVDKEIRRIPFDASFYLTRFMFCCFGRFPHFIIQLLMEDAGNPISFSNVPMATSEVSLFGTKVNQVAGWPPLITNTGFGIIIMRYANYIRFLGIADAACISKEELKFFMLNVTNEIRLMADGCSKKPLDINITHHDIVKV